MDIKFDQHFLIDEEILNKTIKTANITSNDTIYEIGPGQGVLTKKILQNSPKLLISIEKDETLTPYLEKIKQNNSNFQYQISDGITQIDNFEFTKLIANIPYSITEPLYKKILDKKIPFILILHGKTFYDTIIRRNSKWNYFVNAFYDIKLIEEVTGDKFEPPTKTKSALVLLKLKKEITTQDKFLQTLWSKRERNMKNAIIYTLVDLGKTKTQAKEITKELAFKTKKFDNISNEEFIEIIKNTKLYKQ